LPGLLSSYLRAGLLLRLIWPAEAPQGAAAATATARNGLKLDRSKYCSRRAQLSIPLI
jgi:hypothetical protein